MIKITKFEDLKHIRTMDIIGQESVDVHLLIAKAMYMAINYNTWDHRLRGTKLSDFPPLSEKDQCTHDYGFTPIRFNTRDGSTPHSYLSQFEPAHDNNIVGTFIGSIDSGKIMVIDGKEILRLKGEFVLSVSTVFHDIVESIDLPVTFKNQIPEWLPGVHTTLHTSIHRTNDGVKFVRNA